LLSNASVFPNDIKKPGWKVVLQKEASSRKEVVNIKNVFITTITKTNGLNIPKGLQPPPTTIFFDVDVLVSILTLLWTMTFLFFWTSWTL